MAETNEVAVQEKPQQEIAKKQASLKEILTQQMGVVKNALPKEVKPERFIANCITAFNENPDLATCNRNDLVVGFIKGAFLGLDFLLKECYLIKYGKSVNFQTSWQGEKKICMRYAKREILNITAELVREGDIVDIQVQNNNTIINFKPNLFERNKNLVGVLSYVIYKDGGAEWCAMTKDEIEEVRQKFSKAPNSPAWTKSWNEMAKKVCLRRLCKNITIDFETSDQIQAWNDGQDADFNKVKAPSEKVEVIDVADEAVDIKQIENKSEVKENEKANEESK